MHHIVHKAFIIMCILYTTLFFGMEFSTLPTELITKILLYTLYPDATKLAHVATTSKTWNVIINSDSFNEQCATANIPREPTIIFFPIPFLGPNDQKAVHTLKNGLMMYEYGRIFYKPSLLQNTAPFYYIDPSELELEIDKNNNGIFWDACHRFVSIFVNPNTTFVYNNCALTNSILSEEEALLKFEQSKMTLSHHIEQIAKAKKIILQSNERLSFDPITAEAKAVKHINPNIITVSEYNNTIPINLPIPAARFIKDGSFLNFPVVDIDEEDYTETTFLIHNITLELDQIT